MNQEQKINKILEHYSDPEVFGPIFWKFLHIYLLSNYEDMLPEDMEKFIEVFSRGIPCHECKDGFPKQVGRYEYDMGFYTREYGAAKYGNTLHNLVNMKLNKKTVSFEEHIEELYQDTLI